MAEQRSNLLDVGRLSGVFGVKGWLKLRSSTEPAENIFSYSVWWLKTKHGVKAFEVEDHKPHNGTFVVKFKDVDTRDQAELLALVTVSIERSELPGLPEGDYYWDQLLGLQVHSSFSGAPRALGYVSKLLETGANDVLVVSPNEGSIDDRERLIPYVPDMYVKSVDLKAKLIVVDWDADF